MSSSVLDAYVGALTKWAKDGLTYLQMEQELNKLGIETSEASVRRAFARHNIEKPIQKARSKPDVTIDGDKATVRGGDPRGEEITPEELMIKHGLDPDEWEQERIIVNKWDANAGDSAKMPLYQLKVFLKRKAPIRFVFPARVPNDLQLPPKPKLDPNASTLWFVVGDQQAPYHDTDWHKLLCMWLADNKPDHAITLGDTIDFPDISRHRDNPEWHVPAQKCIDVGYEILHDYVQSSKGTRWRKLLGNHDERIRTELLNRAERLYGIRRAQVPGEEEEDSVLDVGHLLRLDELDIELIRPNGNYDDAQFIICETEDDGVVVRHGSRTGPNAAHNTIKRLRHSLIMGHTHRKSMISTTDYDAHQNPIHKVAVEIGCSCLIKGGIGFAKDPDWQNSAASVQVWPDGRYTIDLFSYVEGHSLVWRDKRYML